MVLAAAALVGLGLASLNGWRSHRLAEDHAARAQKAFDEMETHHRNIQLCRELLRTARGRSEKARYEGLITSSRHRLARLEEAGVRHERLARSYGYRAAFRRPGP
jgi:hypothetical protein